MTDIVLMSGTGNTFIVVDNRDNQIKNLIQFTIDNARKYKTDGALIVEHSESADFKMKIINADGSEAEMCGNGARCIAKFAYDKNIVSLPEMTFETLAGLIHGEIKNDNLVKVQLTKPFDLKEHIQINVPHYSGEVFFINTGVPHTVIFVDDIELVDVPTIGKEIRYSDYFQPAGTNVNFVQIITKKKIKVRTYERGVENETQACGTGSTASALISGLVHHCESPLSVITRSKELLTIYFQRHQSDKNFSDIYLEGTVQYL